MNLLIFLYINSMIKIYNNINNMSGSLYNVNKLHMKYSNKDVKIHVERLILQLLSGIVNCRVGAFKDDTWKNIVCNSTQSFKSFKNKKMFTKNVKYRCFHSRHRFVLIVYILAEVHRLQLCGGSCTSRCLYYKDTQMIQCHSKVIEAKINVCRMLNSFPYNLGFVSSVKGLAAGDMQLYMTNGDYIDFNIYKGAMSLPQNYGKIELLITSAKFVLIVEKETIFESLLSRNIFRSFQSSFILITGKGYPDLSTRHIVHHLSCVKQLPVYALVDADPFGIEIMLIYRYGSRSMGFVSDGLAIPKIRWIGLHPSEIQSIKNSAIPFKASDYKKLSNLLSRQFISFEVRQELLVLLQLQQKAEIESVLNILHNDYIPNKIKRNLFL